MIKRYKITQLFDPLDYPFTINVRNKCGNTWFAEVPNNPILNCHSHNDELDAVIKVKAKILKHCFITEQIEEPNNDQTN